MPTELKEGIVLIVSCHSRTEKYIPLVRDCLDVFWPEQPTRFFITDGSSQRSDDVVSYPKTNWVELLKMSVTRIKKERPGTKYIFHMLEDHCPLRCCDGERLDRIFEIAIRRDLVALTFPTYPWPWNETDAIDHPDGRVRTWRCRNTLELESELFAVVPPDFFRYFQVQPTLWRIDYLDAVCANAIAENIVDPWDFEAMRWPKAGQHYISRYDWPTVHHGFLVQGKLNSAAIAYFDRKRARNSHRALVREAIGVECPLVFDIVQKLIRMNAFIRRALVGVQRRVIAKLQ